MILEYSLDHRSHSGVYEKIFLKSLKEQNLKGKIVKNHFNLKLYVEADTPDKLEEFATLFANRLPQSIFLYDTKAQIVEEMPQESNFTELKKLPLPFCIDCLKSVEDENSKDYYNIFKSCDVCGYGIDGENRSYKEDIKSIAKDIAENKRVKVSTFYQDLVIAKLEVLNEDIDILAYDLATILKVARVQEHQQEALASFEKPFVKLSLDSTFKDKYSLKSPLRFKLPDDLLLYFLMKELSSLGINLVALSTNSDYDTEYKLIEKRKRLTPIELVTSNKHRAIARGDRWLPLFKLANEVIPQIGAFYSVINEHKLEDENIAGVILSKKFTNAILVHGRKYGTINYLDLTFNYKTIKDILKDIRDTDETAKKLIRNYKNRYPELFSKIIKIDIPQDGIFNIYRLWGVLAVILGYSDSAKDGSITIEENSMEFLGNRGVRIDYKLKQVDKKAILDPLMMIRSAMSFKMAGVDDNTISFGVVESFAEFIDEQFQTLKDTMQVTSFVFAGSLFENSRLFDKISTECSINHKIYFNNELPIDGKSIFYGKKLFYEE